MSDKEAVFKEIKITP
jgi:translation initiation factor 2 subunit 1